MWWAWALVFVAVLIVVILALKRGDTTANVRREDLPGQRLGDRNDDNDPRTTLGGGFGGM